jgi:hypothetical protein
VIVVVVDWQIDGPSEWQGICNVPRVGKQQVFDNIEHHCNFLIAGMSDLITRGTSFKRNCELLEGGDGGEVVVVFDVVVVLGSQRGNHFASTARPKKSFNK